jgi:hypothetical protein
VDVVVCLDFVIVGETFEEEGCDDMDGSEDTTDEVIVGFDITEDEEETAAFPDEVALEIVVISKERLDEVKVDTLRISEERLGDIVEGVLGTVMAELAASSVVELFVSKLDTPNPATLELVI